MPTYVIKGLSAFDHNRVSEMAEHYYGRHMVGDVLVMLSSPAKPYRCYVWTGSRLRDAQGLELLSFKPHIQRAMQETEGA